MSRWFRFYDSVVDDPKVQRLPPDLFKAWVNVLCVASKHKGILPPVADLAFLLRTDEKNVLKLLARLDDAGLLDDVNGRYSPHGWDNRQHKSDDSTERVRKLRQRRSNGGVTVTGTPPETETEADTEADASGGEPPPPDPAVEQRELYQRGKAVLGSDAGGLISALLRSKGGNVALARAALEHASQAENAVEYVGRILKPLAKQNGRPSHAAALNDAFDDLDERIRAFEERPLHAIGRG